VACRGIIALMDKQKQSGFALVSYILSGALAIVAGLAIWALVAYTSEKSDVESRIDLAVAEAKKEQSEVDEAKFLERENEPWRDFSGPADYGQVTFKYPKTWSVYVNRDGQGGGSYEAYFHPVVVPTVGGGSSDARFALRMSIDNQDYDRVISAYSNDVSRGDLDSSSVKINDVTGTRLQGNFSQDIRGSAVIFKIRDKTLTLRTDAATYQDQFNAIVKTLEFNQ